MKRKTIKHYEIIRRLGAGGSGVVYLANDTLLQRPVVMKILRMGLMSAKQMRTTVLREARLASAIEHPNVCAIYEVGEAGEEGGPGVGIGFMIDQHWDEIACEYAITEGGAITARAGKVRTVEIATTEKVISA